MTDETLKAPNQYPKCKFAIRTLANVHVQVTHPKDFLQHMREVLSRTLYKKLWVYTGFEYNSNQPTGWMPMQEYLEGPSIDSWKPSDSVSLGMAFRNILSRLDQGSEIFLFIPNGDLLFSDHLNVVNLISYSDFLIQNHKYVAPVISYGYGVPSSTLAIENVLPTVDERGGQAHLGVRDAQATMDELKEGFAYGVRTVHPVLPRDVYASRGTNHQRADRKVPKE